MSDDRLSSWVAAAVALFAAAVVLAVCAWALVVALIVFTRWAL